MTLSIHDTQYKGLICDTQIHYTQHKWHSKSCNILPLRWVSHWYLRRISQYSTEISERLQFLRYSTIINRMPGSKQIFHPNLSNFVTFDAECFRSHSFNRFHTPVQNFDFGIFELTDRQTDSKTIIQSVDWQTDRQTERYMDSRTDRQTEIFVES